MVARHFRSIGRRRALVTGPPRDSVRRKAALLVLLMKQPKSAWRSAIRRVGESRTSDAVVFACDLILRDRSIDAYFAGNDLLAVQVLFELQRAGIRVPEDVAICGFDGIGWGQMINPRLTTLKQPLELIASTALDIISIRRRPREAILPVEFL
jgi:LacI family transcriptional regulator